MYIIAEIGINHNGDLDLALQMIKAAKDAGANCVEFQKSNPDKCLLVYWINNRRRDAYHRILSKKGYQFGNMFGSKCLYKIIPKETHKKEEIDAITK